MNQLKSNLKITRDFSRNIQKYAHDAKILVITNPVDAITYFIQKESRLPKENVVGLGSRQHLCNFLIMGYNFYFSRF